MNDSTTMYLEQAAHLLSEPAGLAAVILLLGIAALLTIVPAMRWAVISLVLYASTFGIGSELGHPRDYQRLIGPFHYMALYAREMTLALAMLLLVPAVASSGQSWRRRLVPAGAFVFAGLQLLMSVRLGFGPAGAARPIANALTTLLMLYVLCAGPAQWINSTGSASSLLKGIAGFAFLFVLGNALQMFLNPASIRSARFSGTTVNPQAAGQVCAMLLPTVAALLFYRPLHRVWRLPLAVCCSTLFIFLLWTGSRTSGVMLFVGIVLLFRWQPGRVLIVALILGAFLWVAAHVLPDSLAQVQRFTDVTNSREGPWAAAIALFQQNPIFGAPTTGDAYLESSYLAMLANFGAVGGAFTVVWLIATFAGIMTAERRKRLLGSNSMLANLAIANLGMLLTGSIFEASLMSPVSPLVLLLYCNFALLGYVLNAERHAMSGPVFLDDAHEPQPEAVYAADF